MGILLWLPRLRVAAARPNRNASKITNYGWVLERAYASIGSELPTSIRVWVRVPRDYRHWPTGEWFDVALERGKPVSSGTW
jgi:hypothetical protein